MKLSYLYACARSHNVPASIALAGARAYIAGPLAKYQADLEAWNAQPDKRRYAAGGSANRPKYPYFYKMRSNDAHGPRYLENGNYATIPTCVLDGLRDLGHVDTIRPDGYALISHHGWFADAFQHETYRGKVWQLPARDGTLQYIAGYSEDGSGYSVLDATRGTITLFDSLRDAIGAADHCAEHFAEEAREYSERWQEASSANDERADARKAAEKARAEWVALSRAMRSEMSERTWKQLGKMRDEKHADHRASVTVMRKASERISELGMEGEF